MTKIVNNKILILTAMFLGGCSYFDTIYSNRVVQPLVKNPTSVVVCREKQCAPARLSMSKEYIYNSLLQLLQNNKGSKALLCTADAATRTCTEEFLSMPIKVGITPANMYIDSVKITNAKAVKGAPKIDLNLYYDVTYNGQTPFCKPARTIAFVESPDSIVMEDSGYSCQMTVIGTSSVKTVFAIDYLDLDYGYIGGYYSIGVSGPANGGGAGYMLIRLPVNAYPLSPALLNYEDTKASRSQFNHKLSTPTQPTKRDGSLQVFPLYSKKDAAKTTAAKPAPEKATEATTTAPAASTTAPAASTTAPAATATTAATTGSDLKETIQDASDKASEK